MNHILVTTVLSFLSGVVGTGLGGMAAVAMPKPNRKVISATLAFAGGIMFSMVAFDLVPSAIDEGGLPLVLPGLALGLMMMLNSLGSFG